VSVILPTLNRRESLRRVLESLFYQTYPEDKFEIIVIDGGSTDGTQNMVKDLIEISPCELRYLKQENKGVAAARNLGIRNAKGEIIAFTDDDCMLSKEWLAALVHHFDDPKVGGVGSIREALNKDNLLAEAWDLAYFRIGSLQEKYDFLNNSPFLCTSSAAIRFDALSELGGFDENLVSGEDVDLSRRVLEKGYKLVLEPSARVKHEHPSSWRALVKQQLWFGKGDAQREEKLRKNNTFCFVLIYRLLGAFFYSFKALVYTPKIKRFKLNIMFPLFVLIQCLSRNIGWFTYKSLRVLGIKSFLKKDTKTWIPS